MLPPTICISAIGSLEECPSHHNTHYTPEPIEQPVPAPGSAGGSSVLSLWQCRRLGALFSMSRFPGAQKTSRTRKQRSFHFAKAAENSAGRSPSLEGKCSTTVCGECEWTGCPGANDVEERGKHGWDGGRRKVRLSGDSRPGTMIDR